MQQVHDRIRRYPGTTFSYAKRAAEAIAEHEGLIDAVERHEEDTAGRLALDHMGRALEIRVMMLDPRQAPSKPSADGTEMTRP
jgi:DNA-binding GntR family transcriptional regulator